MQESLFTHDHATGTDRPTPRRRRTQSMHPNTRAAGAEKSVQSARHQVLDLLVFALEREQAGQKRFFRGLFKDPRAPFKSDTFGWRKAEALEAGLIVEVGTARVPECRTPVSIYELTDKGRAAAQAELSRRRA